MTPVVSTSCVWDTLGASEEALSGENFFWVWWGGYCVDRYAQPTGSQTWPQRRLLLPLFPSWLQELRLDLSPTCPLASACVHTQMLQAEVVGQGESPSAAFWSSPEALTPASPRLLCERGPLPHTCADIWGILGGCD